MIAPPPSKQPQGIEGKMRDVVPCGMFRALHPVHIAVAIAVTES
jgi:hypothetical protein